MSRRFDRQFAATDRLPYIADTNDEAIELESLDVQVLVTGLFAETTQTLRLHNPNRRDLEGNLCFPLPDGAVVCGYGLDVDGKLVDGVVVPKEEARRILEAEIRKGVDPGLVEQVQGNVYRTRIYPLPAGGSRTVKIVYISRLTVEGNDAAYHLPLGHADGVDKVSLRVEVSQTPVEPALVGGLGNLTLNQFENRRRGRSRSSRASSQPHTFDPPPWSGAPVPRECSAQGRQAQRSEFVRTAAEAPRHRRTPLSPPPVSPAETTRGSNRQCSPARRKSTRESRSAVPRRPAQPGPPHRQHRHLVWGSSQARRPRRRSRPGLCSAALPAEPMLVRDLSHRHTL